MRPTSIKSISLLLTFAAAAHGQSTQKVMAPTSQPTPADVQILVNAKDYAAAIKVSNKLLSLRGPSVAGMSRFEITMLKGDAQAGQKAISAAVATYKSAAVETKDPHEQALSRWTSELFHTAGSVVYTPKIAVGMKKRGPFDLTQIDQRKQGFEALLDDNLSLLEPKLKAATVSPSIVQVWPILQQIVDLSQLDEIANGSDEKTTAIASALLDHSRNLLSNLLKGYWARLGDIDAHANAMTTSQVSQFINGQSVLSTYTVKNGLSDSNKSELREMIAMSKKSHDAAEELMKLAKTDQGWAPLLADSNRVAGRAGDVLNTDYTSSSSQTTGTPYDTGFNGIGVTGGVQYGNGSNFHHRPTSRPVKPKPTSQP